MESMGESTMLAQDNAFAFPDEDDGTLLALEYWRDPDHFASFADMLAQAAVTAGYDGDPQDRSAVCRYIIGRGAEKGISFEEWKKTLQNWVNGKEVGRDEKARDRVYQLCFALDMSSDQVRDFFRRGYWERVVNYRAENECVYWYCLKKGLPYARAVEILEQVRQAREAARETEEYPLESTMAIGQAVLSCPDEAALVRCLVERTEAFAQKSTTAVAQVERLLKKGKELFGELYHKGKLTGYYSEDQVPEMVEDEEERRKRRKGEPVEEESVSTERFLNCIYGVPARTYGIKEEDDSGEGDGKKKRGYLPKDPLAGAGGSFPLGYARKCIPSDAQLDKILAGQSDHDSARKALVFLHFATFVLEKMAAGVEDGDVYDEFLDEVNQSLLKSGFPELYLRNPYDWLFAYCMTRQDPLDALHEMLSPLNREEEPG